MKDKLLTTLEKSKNYTLLVAEAMPAERYDFKPANEVMNFRELMHHIAYTIEWMEDNYLLGKKTEWSPVASNGKKNDAIKYLAEEFAGLEKTMEHFKTLGENELLGLNAILDHTTHHRGQAVTYLRCNNITPPEYTY